MSNATFRKTYGTKTTLLSRGIEQIIPHYVLAFDEVEARLRNERYKFVLSDFNKSMFYFQFIAPFIEKTSDRPKLTCGEVSFLTGVKERNLRRILSTGPFCNSFYISFNENHDFKHFVTKEKDLSGEAVRVRKTVQAVRSRKKGDRSHNVGFPPGSHPSLINCYESGTNLISSIWQVDEKVLSKIASEKEVCALFEPLTDCIKKKELLKLIYLRSSDVEERVTDLEHFNKTIYENLKQWKSQSSYHKFDDPKLDQLINALAIFIKRIEVSRVKLKTYSLTQNQEDTRDSESGYSLLLVYLSLFYSCQPALIKLNQLNEKMERIFPRGCDISFKYTGKQQLA